jgi:ribose 5-phosphate isomerase B
MKIALGADHAGFELKENVKKLLKENGADFVDFGTDSPASVDYPDYAKKVGEAVSHGVAKQGILVCGSGTGMAIAANKIHGVRAAVAWNEETARLAREHNNANILCLGSRTMPAETIPPIIKAWLSAKFEGGRHNNRVGKISEMEAENDRRGR